MLSNLKINSGCRVGIRGFSLIELSVLISVAASATVGFLAWTQPSSSTNAQNAAITISRMQEIQKSIENFRVLKKRLPCPADALMRDDNTRATGDNYDNPISTTNGCAGPPGKPYDCYLNDFGKEDLFNIPTISGSGPTNGIKTGGITTQLLAGASCPLSKGAVPVFALGLDGSYANDGWGRRFTYHVSSSLCGTNGVAVGSLTKDSPGCTPNEYKEKSGTLIVSASPSNNTLANNAAYVLVSHGANGYGAFLPSGVKIGQSSDTNEAKNSDVSTVARYVKGDKTSSFDDIVMFSTKNMIESVTNRNNTKNISVSDCEANSQAIRRITMTETSVMRTNYSSQEQVNDATLSLAQNTGDQALLSILWATQSICVKYYGSSSTPKVINGQTWSGPKCPGTINVSAPTYDSTSNSCECKSKFRLWDGNCTTSGPGDGDIAGLQVWLDSNDSTTLFTNSGCTTPAANGNTIGCWKDKSGNSRNAIYGAGTITYYTGRIGILPGVNFASGNNYLNLNLAFLANSNYTIMVVDQRRSNVGEKYILGSRGGSGVSNQNLHFGYRSQTSFTLAQWANDLDVAITGYSSLIPHYIGGWFDSASGHYIEFSGSDGSFSATNSNTTGLSLVTNGNVAGGVHTDGTNQYIGDIGEIIIYSTKLSNTDYSKIKNYLRIKWGTE